MNLIVEYNQAGKLKDHMPHEKINFIVALKQIAISHGTVNVTADLIDYADTFIYKHFAHLTQFEICYAFELYALGKLPIENKREWSANFNLEFIAAVLHAYIEYRRPILEEYKRVEASKRLPQTATPVEIPWKQAQMEAGRLFDKTFMTYIHEHKSMPVAADFMFEAAYDFLIWTKALTEQTPDEKMKYAERMKEVLMTRAENQKFMMRISQSQYSDRIKEINDAEKFGTICRAEVAREYYQQLLKSLLDETNK